MFIILTLPRSRSAWLAHYLNYAPARRCGHDIAIECSTIDEFLNPLVDGWMHGTVETGAVVAWRLLMARLPEAKFIVIKRPLSEVQASLAKLNVSLVAGELEARAMLLELASQQPGVVTLQYSELDYPETCQRLFEYCLEIPWDEEWYKQTVRFNIQIDMPARLQQLAKNRLQLDALQAQVLVETSKLLGNGYGLH